MTKHIPIQYWREVKPDDKDYGFYMDHAQGGSFGVDYNGKQLYVLEVLK